MKDLISFDGTRLSLSTLGQASAPVVVLVHGLGLSTESWGPVPELLASTCLVVAYDLRGHARSGDASNGDYSLTAHARDLDAVLATAAPDGLRVVVVGNSLGGGIIVACAHECGIERMGGVVFAGSGGSGVTFPGFPARRVPELAEDRLRFAWMQVLRATARVGRRIRPIESVSNALVRRFAFTSTAPREVVDRVREDFLSTRLDALSATTLASVSHDGTRMAPSLTVPTLVLHGSEDPEVPGEELQVLLDALPEAELVSITGEGHMLPLTDGELVADQVARWVRHVRL